MQHPLRPVLGPVSSVVKILWKPLKYPWIHNAPCAYQAHHSQRRHIAPPSFNHFQAAHVRPAHYKQKLR